MTVLPAPVRVPSQWLLAPSVVSLSANDKVDNEMKPEAVHRFTLRLRNNPEKPQLGDCPTGLCDQSYHKMGSLIAK